MKTKDGRMEIDFDRGVVIIRSKNEATNNAKNTDRR